MDDRRRHESNWTRWGALTGLVCLPVLAIGAFGFAPSAGDPPPAEGAAPAGDDQHLCAGGAVGEVDIELRSEDVTGSGADRGLRLSLEVTNHTNADREVSYAVEVLSVNGSVQGKRTFAAPRRFRAGERASLPSFEAPRGLADGYYRVLVTTLATGAEDYELADTRELYIRSRNGAASVVSHDEWYELSGIQRHGRQG